MPGCRLGPPRTWVIAVALAVSLPAAPAFPGPLAAAGGQPAPPDLSGIYLPKLADPLDGPSGWGEMNKRLQPWALKRANEILAGLATHEPSEAAYNCRPIGVPAIDSENLAREIIQTRDRVYINYEFTTRTRRVRIGGKHEPPGPEGVLGDSIGWYEPDGVLVIETINISPRTPLIFGDITHFGRLKVTDRYRRLAANRIEVASTMEDPDVLTSPWTLRRILVRDDGSAAAIMREPPKQGQAYRQRLDEYICAENLIDGQPPTEPSIWRRGGPLKEAAATR